jgi:hypothetical protein
MGRPGWIGILNRPTSHGGRIGESNSVVAAASLRPSIVPARRSVERLVWAPRRD